MANSDGFNYSTTRMVNKYLAGKKQVCTRLRVYESALCICECGHGCFSPVRSYVYEYVYVRARACLRACELLCCSARKWRMHAGSMPQHLPQPLNSHDPLITPYPLQPLTRTPPADVRRAARRVPC